MAGYRKLPSGLWQASIRLPDGRRRTRTDPLKGVVRTWAEDAEAAIRRGEWADPKDGRVTLAEWWADWSAARLIELATSRRDESHWKVHLEPRWGRVKLSAITAMDIEVWLADMKRAGVGPTTIAQSFRLLRHMLSTAARHKMIGVDPTATVKPPKVPKHVDRFLTWPEWVALRDALPSDRDRAMCSLMALSGLRWGEVAGLHSHRVDLTRRELRVVEVLQRDGSIKPAPKSVSGQRVVPLTESTSALLGPLLSGHERVFPSVDYTNWRRRVFVPAVRAAGLAEPHPTPHDLRHSFGSWLAEAGVPVHEIQASLGHSTLRATERYLHAGDGRLARTRDVLSVRELGA